MLSSMGKQRCSEHPNETFGDKTCACHGTDYRDPESERDHPDSCPWRAFDLMMLIGPLPRKSGH